MPVARTYRNRLRSADDENCPGRRARRPHCGRLRPLVERRAPGGPRTEPLARLVYAAVTAEIDWDTEEGLAALSDQFRRNYIHFEGQFVSADTRDVRLVTPRSAQAALAMRALSRLHSGTLSPAEIEAQLEISLPWVERWADEVRQQLHGRFAAVKAGTPDARATAAVLLAAGAVVRGATSFSADEAEFFAATFADWPAASPEYRTAAWRICGSSIRIALTMCTTGCKKSWPARKTAASRPACSIRRRYCRRCKHFRRR